MTRRDTSKVKISDSLCGTIFRLVLGIDLLVICLCFLAIANIVTVIAFPLVTTINEMMEVNK